MSYYLNLHQGAGAKNEQRKIAILYSLVLPPVGIQSCELRAAYFHINVLSTFHFSP